jgi:putative peptidoglycan lipid II flippase
MQDKEVARDVMDEAITFSMALTLPAAAALACMPFYLIDGLYTRGHFTAFDAEQTSRTLLFYGLGTPAFVLARVLSPAFFARQDTKSPMRFAIISVVVNIATGVALFRGIPGTPFTGIGVAGIAAGTAIASWLNVIQMFAALARRGDYAIRGRAATRILRILAASAVTGAAMFAAQYVYQDPTLKAQIIQPTFAVFDFYFHGRHVSLVKEVSLAAVSAAGLVLYFVLLFAFGGLKLSELKKGLSRKGGRIETAEETMGKTPAGPDLL